MFFFFSSRRRHTRCSRDWSSDVCSSDLPGAVDHRKFHPAIDRASIRRQLGLPTDRMVLFTVRNLGPRMGLENLLHALNEQGEELRDVLVLIGGEGPLRPRLEGLIRSLDLTGRVRLLGFIPEEYLPRYYQAADLMLLPTAELEGDRKSVV